MDIERQVLYDAVTMQDEIGEIAPIITRDMFTSETRMGIWDIIVAMHNSGEQIDLKTVFGRVGSGFTEEVVTPSNVLSTPLQVFAHAKALRDAAARRRAYTEALNLLMESSRGNHTEEDIQTLVDDLAKEVAGNGPIAGEESIGKVVADIANEVEERAVLAAQGKSNRIPTSFSALDALTYSGWGPGQLIILAARPSVGKTAVMLQMAKTAASAGFPTMVFSLEMTNSELGQRLLYSTNFIEPAQVMSGDMDWERFELAAERISDIPLYVNDFSRNISDIISRILVSAQAGRCSIAFIDYLGLIQSESSSNTTVAQSIAKITGALKATAKRARIPIVLLSQLNRKSAEGDRAPELYDLRDSGSIEQDADIVLMLEPVENPYDEDATPDLNIWLRKNRQYKRDVCIQVRPNETYTKFDPVVPEGYYSTAPNEAVEEDEAPF